jgi:hypothetical protein
LQREQPGAPSRSAPSNPSPSRDDEDGPPDPAALIARLRRQRQQREAAQAASSRSRERRNEHKRGDAGAAVERRFADGERIFCLPYGDGVVQDSRVEDGRELLTVAFPEHGELTIDPAVSLVRKLEDAAPDEDDAL